MRNFIKVFRIIILIPISLMDSFLKLLFHPSLIIYFYYPHLLKINKFPGYFDFVIIKRCISFIPDIESRLKYLELLINSLSELFSLESDSDIKKFIKKYRLQDFELSRRYYYYDTSTAFQKLKFISKKYGKLQASLYFLIISLKLYQSLHLDFKKIIERNNINIVFYKDEFMEYYYSINNEFDRISWCRELLDLLNKVCLYSDDRICELLFKAYNLNGKYHIHKSSIITDFKYYIDYSFPKYSSFIFYLRESFLPFVSNHIEEMDFKMKLAEAKQKYPDNYESVEEKYPVFDFKYERITNYADEILKLTKDKIEYYSYLDLKYKYIVFGKYPYPKHYNETISKINIAIEHLKTVYQLEIKNANMQIPDNVMIKSANELVSSDDKSKTPRLGDKKKAEYKELIKRYFHCAVGLNCVPSQKQLAYNHLSEATWSRYMNDELFVPVLLKEIDKRRKKSGLSKKMKDLYEALYDDILDRNIALEQFDNGRTGQVNKNVKPFNENMKKKDINIFDDEEDNKYLNR